MAEALDVMEGGLAGSDGGRKVAVQINLKEHRELWQDIQDVLVSRSRRHESAFRCTK